MRRRADFLAANKGVRVATPGFVLLVHPRGDDSPETGPKPDTVRLGITVTKKIGNAVVRNRMKRRFRALARPMLADRGIAGADHVLIGREGGIDRDFAALQGELAAALERIRQGKGDSRGFRPRRKGRSNRGQASGRG